MAGGVGGGAGLPAPALHLDGNVDYFGRVTRKWRSRYLAVHDGELSWWEAHENAHAPPAGDGGSGGGAIVAAAVATPVACVAPDWRPTTKAIGSVPLLGLVFAAIDADLARAVRSELGADGGVLAAAGGGGGGGLGSDTSASAAAAHPVVSALRGGSGGDLGERRGSAMVLAYAAATGVGPGLREPLVIATASREEALLWAVTLSVCTSGGTLPMAWVARLSSRYGQSRVAHARLRGGMALATTLAPLLPLPGLGDVVTPAAVVAAPMSAPAPAPAPALKSTSASAPAPASAATALPVSPALSAAAQAHSVDGAGEGAVTTSTPSSSSPPPAPPPRPRTNTGGGGVPAPPPHPPAPAAAPTDGARASDGGDAAATNGSRSGSWTCAEDGVERHAMRKKM